MKLEHGEDWNLETLIKLLKVEIETRECVQTKVSNRGTFSVDNKRPNYSKSNPPTAAALYTSESPGNTPDCTYCRGKHPSADCHVVINLQERKNILRSAGRCFRCLRRSGHIARDCKASVRCYKCNSQHHVSLCNCDPKLAISKPGLRVKAKEFVPRENESSKPNPPETETVHTGHIGTDNATDNNVVLLQTAQAYISAPGNEKNEKSIRVLFDGGSQRTYVTEQLKTTLNLPIVRSENLVIKTFGTDNVEMKQCDAVKLVLKNQNKTFQTEVDALVTPLICSPLQGQEVKLAKETFPHLFNLDLADEFPEAEAHVDILIGADVMWRFMSGETRRGESPNSPIAIAMKLGWVLSGPMAEIPKSKMSSVNLNATHVLFVANSGIPAQTDEVLQNQVNRFWELESIGIVDKESDSVHEEFKRSLTFENGRYTAKLPFKEQHSILPDNFKLSATRLNNQLKRLKQLPHILKEYSKIITDQLESGIIEELNPLMDCPEPGKVHYLPHHPVIREQAETTKIRVVYDASAKLRTDTPSLNQCLNIGPSLIPTIFDILLRF